MKPGASYPSTHGLAWSGVVWRLALLHPGTSHEEYWLGAMDCTALEMATVFLPSLPPWVRSWLWPRGHSDRQLQLLLKYRQVLDHQTSLKQRLMPSTQLEPVALGLGAALFCTYGGPRREGAHGG